MQGCVLESKNAAEIFLTAVPDPSLGLAEQAEALFADIRKVLQARGAHLLQERLFAGKSAIPAALAARGRAYGPLDDGVSPVLLAVPMASGSGIAGVQVHAVRTKETPRIVRLGGEPCGRTLTLDGLEYVALSGLVAPEAGTAKADQGRAVFTKTAAALREAGCSMKSVVRTWLWLGDILAWYDDLNRVRNQFFHECGLLDGDPRAIQLPASTGIGVRPAGAAECAVDAIAMTGPRASIEFFRDAGNQRSAFNYGSAFSRSSRAVTPAGKTVYVSGTAAIDAAGATIFVDDARGQIGNTIDNVRAVLRDMGCGDGDVVQAIAYSKTPEVEKVFREGWADLGWPCLSVIADVCRDNLLFEVEATACPGSSRF